MTVLSDLVERARRLDMKGGLGAEAHDFLRDVVQALVMAEHALVPFSDECERWVEMGVSRPIASDTGLTVRDLRRAARALGEEPDA